MSTLIRTLNGLGLILSPGEHGSPQAHASPAALAQFLNDDFPGA